MHLLEADPPERLQKRVTGYAGEAQQKKSWPVADDRSLSRDGEEMNDRMKIHALPIFCAVGLVPIALGYGAFRGRADFEAGLAGSGELAPLFSQLDESSFPREV